MLSQAQVDHARARAAELLARAGVPITPAERAQIEVADFGLADLERTGLQLITYINTDRYCAKELMLFPRQTCPEHRHPPVGAEPGKMETFRCRWGSVFLYVAGPSTAERTARPPAGTEAYFTVFHELVLAAGDQFTIPPDTLHWFRAGDEGAIVSEFSTRSRDETDVFTDPRIVR